MLPRTDMRAGAAQPRHGLGWAYARRGDLVRALDHLDRAADQFREVGYDGLEIEVDRVECLLAVIVGYRRERAGP